MLPQGNTRDRGTFFAVLMGRPFPPHLPVPPGDIAALQNIPLEVLRMYRCEKLTGKSACAWGGSVKVLPQGNTRSIPGTFLNFMRNPSPLPQRSTGDISVLRHMALAGLRLGGCSKLTGTLPPYILVRRYSGQNRVVPGQH